MKQSIKEPVTTNQAPAAIGTYSQAMKVGNTVYLSGQIPLDPQTMQLVSDDISAQIHQVFKNLLAVVKAADVKEGGGDASQIVQLRVYLTDLSRFALVNEIMQQYISEPYPARAAVQVSALPKGAQVEIEGIMVLESV